MVVDAVVVVVSGGRTPSRAPKIVVVAVVTSASPRWTEGVVLSSQCTSVEGCREGVVVVAVGGGVSRNIMSISGLVVLSGGASAAMVLRRRRRLAVVEVASDLAGCDSEWGNVKSGSAVSSVANRGGSSVGCEVVVVMFMSVLDPSCVKTGSSCGVPTPSAYAGSLSAAAAAEGTTCVTNASPLGTERGDLLSK